MQHTAPHPLTPGPTFRDTNLRILLTGLGVLGLLYAVAMMLAWQAGVALELISKPALTIAFAISAASTYRSAKLVSSMTRAHALAWRLCALAALCSALQPILGLVLMRITGNRQLVEMTQSLYVLCNVFYFAALLNLPFRPLDQDERPLLVIDLAGMSVISAGIITLAVNPTITTRSEFIVSSINIATPVMACVLFLALIKLTAREWQLPTRRMYLLLMAAGFAGMAGDVAQQLAASQGATSAFALSDAFNIAAAVFITLATTGAAKSIFNYVMQPVRSMRASVARSSAISWIAGGWLAVWGLAIVALGVWLQFGANNLSPSLRAFGLFCQLTAVLLLIARQQLLRTTITWFKTRYAHLMAMPQILTEKNALNDIIAACFNELFELLAYEKATLALVDGAETAEAFLISTMTVTTAGRLHGTPVRAVLPAEMAQSARNGEINISILEHERSWISVPLIFKGTLIGALMVMRNGGAEYTANHAELLTTYAGQVVAAITGHQLRHIEAKNAAISERSRLARELHDSVSQQLYASSLMSRTAQHLLTTSPQAAAEPLAQSLTLTDGALSEMRALIFELRPESLEEEGLIGAFKKQAAALCARHRIDVRTSFEIPEPDLSIQLKEMLYRVGMEAIQNTIKHANATQIQLRLAGENGRISISVRDNGIGFNPNGSFPGHLGLKTMRERVAPYGGRVTIDSTPGAGTVVCASL